MGMARTGTSTAGADTAEAFTTFVVENGPRLKESLISALGGETNTHFEPDLEGTQARLDPHCHRRGRGVGGYPSRCGSNGRATREVDRRLTQRPRRFFLGGEYGQTGDPEAFAAKLREVLDT